VTDNIHNLIAKLADTNDDAAWEAARALIDIGEPAVLPLIEALSDRGRLRLAAWALGHLRDKRAVAPLLDALNEYRDSDERGSIIVGLAGTADMRVLEPFMELMRSGSRLTTDEEDTIIGGLRAMEDLAVNRLRAALGDSDPVLRRRALRALDWLDGERALQPYVALLDDPVENIRAQAALRLGGLSDTRAIEPLIGTLSDPSEDVRCFAAMALGRLTSQEAVEPLVSMLSDESRKVRRAVLGALGSIGDPKAIEPVAKVLLAEEEAFRGIADAAATPPVLWVLGNRDDDGVRFTALDCLARLGHTQVLDELIAALDNINPEIRSLAAHLLASASGFRSVYRLVEDFNDHRPLGLSKVGQFLVPFDEVTFELERLATGAADETRLRIFVAVLEWTVDRVKAMLGDEVVED